MIGVDTNILVRYLTQDDPAQGRRVDRLVEDALDAGDRLHIDDVVLCEVVWVLRASYRLSKAAIVDAVEQILGTALFAFEDRDRMRRALDSYRDGGGDFADYVIGLRNLRAGCAATATLDRSLQGDSTFQQL